ncbi:hypothetical protein N9U76_01315 [Prochlorococcus sp. AH-736-L19]|nr:hypothetical protein [Prochlorococcus sp. AH-736-L19]MDA9704057.1 hypothetical protein [Prochlorococcus sp. AH-736-L19]
MTNQNFSQNGDIILIDVGTHSSGEIKSFTDSKFFFFKLIKRIIKNIYKKRSLNINFFISLIINHFKLKNVFNKITLILIEPNYLHFEEKPYKFSTMVIPAAVNSINNKNSSRTIKLFFANNDPKSAGNSIFSSKGNVNKNNFRNVLSLNSYELLEIIENTYLHKNSKVILRINCEGMEDEIIYEFKKYLANRLKGIMGSLKDVKSIKGKKKYYQLMEFINNEEIIFIPFSDDIDTWNKAHSFLYSLL